MGNGRSSEVVACVDMGTTRVKGGILADDGTIVAETDAAAPPVQDWHGFVAFDAAAYLQQVHDVLREITAHLDDVGTVQALVLTNQRATVVPVSQDGTAVGPALSWEDTSGDPHFSAFVEGFGPDRFSGITGLPPSALWSLAELLRLREDVPETYRQTAKAVLLHDYVLHSLGTERFLTDASNGSVTGMQDVRKRQWSDEILSAADISPSMLPEITEPGQVCGSLADRPTAVTGLPKDLPLIVGGGDQQCAVLGIGASEHGDAALCLGTAAVLSCPVNRPMPESAGRFFCTAHVIPDRWVLEGIHNAFASSMEWAGTMLGMPSLAERDKALLNSPPGASGVSFLPFLSGIGSPDYDAAVAGTFLGLKLNHTAADLMRAVHEGVVLETRRLIDAVAGECGVTRIIVGGGFTTGETGQILADIMGRDIVVADVREASLLGAAALAWTGAGRYTNVAGAARQLAGKSCRTLQPRDAGVYNGIYEEYKKRVRDLRETYST